MYFEQRSDEPARDRPGADVAADHFIPRAV
jgi:hypothetical protein